MRRITRLGERQAATAAHSLEGWPPMSVLRPQRDDKGLIGVWSIRCTNRCTRRASREVNTGSRTGYGLEGAARSGGEGR